MTDPEIICIGAAHWDVIACADQPLPRGADAPGVILRRPGGVALNVAHGLARLGRSVGLVSVIGRDAEGEQLVALLEAEGVNCAWMVRSANHPTASYLAIEDAKGELVAAVADCAALEAPELVALLDAPRRDRGSGRADSWFFHPPAPDDAEQIRYARAIFFDANLPEAALAALPRFASQSAVPISANAVSPAKAVRLRKLLETPDIPANMTRVRSADWLYATRTEAEAILGATFGTALDAALALRRTTLAAGGVIVTDGARAAASVSDGCRVELTPPTRAVRSVTGAGDALTAAHLDAILGGAAPDAALRAGLAAAAAHISGDAP
jgi:sugar/nucleoside kinase (ribokinase family)